MAVGSFFGSFEPSAFINALILGDQHREHLADRSSRADDHLRHRRRHQHGAWRADHARRLQLLHAAEYFGLPFLLCVPASFVIVAAVGLILERGLIRYLYKRPLDTLLATFGVSLVSDAGRPADLRQRSEISRRAADLLQQHRSSASSTSLIVPRRRALAYDRVGGGALGLVLPDAVRRPGACRDAEQGNGGLVRHQCRPRLHADFRARRRPRRDWPARCSAFSTSCCRPWARATSCRRSWWWWSAAERWRAASLPGGATGELQSIFAYFTNDTFARFVLFVLIVVFLRIRHRACSRRRRRGDEADGGSGWGRDMNIFHNVKRPVAGLCWSSSSLLGRRPAGRDGQLPAQPALDLRRLRRCSRWRSACAGVSAASSISARASRSASAPTAWR